MIFFSIVSPQSILSRENLETHKVLLKFETKREKITIVGEPFLESIVDIKEGEKGRTLWISGFAISFKSIVVYDKIENFLGFRTRSVKPL